MRMITVLQIMLFAMSAVADFRVVDIVNGTNEMTIAGAYSPVSFELMGVNPGEVVNIDRQRDSVVYRKEYDVTTNEIHWTEMVIKTNDTYTIDNPDFRSLINEELGTYTYNGLYADDDLVVAWKNSTYAKLYSTNLVVEVAELTPRNVVGVCRKNGTYVIVTMDEAYYGDHPSNVVKSTSYGMPYTTSLACGNGKFVAAGAEDASSTVGKAAYSVDGNVWNDIVYSGNRCNVRFMNGKFYLFGESGVWSSEDGVAYSNVCTTNVADLMYFDGKYFANIYVPYQKYSLCSTSDFQNWREILSVNYSTGSIKMIGCFPKRNVLYVDSVGIRNTIKSDGSYAVYSGALSSMSVLTFTESGVVYTLGSASINKLVEYGNKEYIFAGPSQSGGSPWDPSQSGEVSWTNAIGGIVEYNSTGNPWYWHYADGAGNETSNNSVQEGFVSVEFDYPADNLTTMAIYNKSRATNYVEHVDYEYVTNRVWNVVDSRITRTDRILSAVCEDGTFSGPTTNDMFLVTGDKIVVDGLVDDGDNKSKAMLICK